MATILPTTSAMAIGALMEAALMAAIVMMITVMMMTIPTCEVGLYKRQAITGVVVPRVMLKLSLTITILPTLMRDKRTIRGGNMPIPREPTAKGG